MNGRKNKATINGETVKQIRSRLHAQSSSEWSSAPCYAEEEIERVRRGPKGRSRAAQSGLVFLITHKRKNREEGEVQSRCRAGQRRSEPENQCKNQW